MKQLVGHQYVLGRSMYAIGGVVGNELTTKMINIINDLLSKGHDLFSIEVSSTFDEQRHGTRDFVVTMGLLTLEEVTV